VARIQGYRDVPGVVSAGALTAAHLSFLQDGPQPGRLNLFVKSSAARRCPPSYFSHHAEALNLKQFRVRPRRARRRRIRGDVTASPCTPERSCAAERSCRFGGGSSNTTKNVLGIRRPDGHKSISERRGGRRDSWPIPAAGMSHVIADGAMVVAVVRIGEGHRLRADGVMIQGSYTHRWPVRPSPGPWHQLGGSEAWQRGSVGLETVCRRAARTSFTVGTLEFRSLSGRLEHRRRPMNDPSSFSLSPLDGYHVTPTSKEFQRVRTDGCLY